MKYTGTVIWWTEGKGYGFIFCEELGRDVFVHHTALQAGLKQLVPDQVVELEVTEGEKGLLAVSVAPTARRSA